jgi:hypothetical protein
MVESMMFSFDNEDPSIVIARRDWLSEAYNKACSICGKSNWRKLPAKIVNGSVRYQAPRCITCKAKEQANNRSYYNSANAAYRARKYSQTPLNADKAIIGKYYQRAEELGKLTGVKYHVDHIKPLNKGGLHHQDNIQVIPEYDNCSKCDRERPDVYGERLMEDGSWSKNWLPFV